MTPARPRPHHEQVVHAVREVVHDDPVQVVGVPPEAAVHGVALAAALPVLAGGLAFLLQSKPFMLNLETNICEVTQLRRRPIIGHGIK